jgi:hypothetical protein
MRCGCCICKGQAREANSGHDEFQFNVSSVP